MMHKLKRSPDLLSIPICNFGLLFMNGRNMEIIRLHLLKVGDIIIFSPRVPTSSLNTFQKCCWLDFLVSVTFSLRNTVVASYDLTYCRKTVTNRESSDVHWNPFVAFPEPRRVLVCCTYRQVPHVTRTRKLPSSITSEFESFFYIPSITASHTIIHTLIENESKYKKISCLLALAPHQPSIHLPIPWAFGSWKTPPSLLGVTFNLLTLRRNSLSHGLPQYRL